MLKSKFIFPLFFLGILLLWLYGLRQNKKNKTAENTKFQKCPNCSIDFLEPKFKWWQYTFLISTPVGFLVFGSPYAFGCGNCYYSVENQAYGKVISRIALTHRLTPAFFIGFSVNIIAIILMFFAL